MCSVKTILPQLVQIKGLWRWKNNLHLMQTLPCFFRPSPFVSDTRIPDASEKITLPFNSHTLWNPRFQHNYCLFLLTISTDVLQSLSFIQFVPQITMTSSLFNQVSFLTQALFCCLALDAWCFLQIIYTTSRSLFSFLSSITASVRFFLFLGQSPSTCIFNYLLSW